MTETLSHEPQDVLPVDELTPGTARGLLQLFEEQGEENVGPLLFGDDPRSPSLVVISPERFDDLRRCVHEIAARVHAENNEPIEEYQTLGQALDGLEDPSQALVPVDQAGPVVVETIDELVAEDRAPYLIMGEENRALLVVLDTETYQWMISCAEEVGR